MLERHAILIAAFLAAVPAATFAQERAPVAPVAPGQNCLTPTDKSGTSDCNTNTQSLSKTLSQSGGVITPPATGDASVKTPPPQGKTPIIPPPGTPGGNQDVQPK